MADDADSEGWQFVQENGRTYYKKGDIKEKAWRVIDGKYYYFDHVSGEMVVGWQYIPFPSKGSTIGPYPNGLRLEFMPMPRWYYFNQDGVLQEFVGKQVLEAKTATNTNKHHGEQYDSPACLLYTSEVSILKDVVTVMIDTTGTSLFKRGYRTEKGGAPIKENMRCV